MSRRVLKFHFIALLGISLLGVVAAMPAFAGGPLMVGSPSLGGDGRAFTWDNTRPVTYRVDPGPLSSLNGVVKYDNTYGVNMVNSMFNVWHQVPTANISFANAGPILATGSYTGGDVQTVSQYADVDASCGNAVQSPVIFDADGSLFNQLVGDPNVIAFTGACALTTNGHIASAEAVMNGAFINGGTSYQLTMAQFNGTFIHEFGHFIGLDHSQINVNCLSSCTADDIAGLPTMFPIMVTDQQQTLATDDMAWVSKLYPAANYNANYGLITGHVYASDGTTPIQGVNVIARRVDDVGTQQNESRIYAASAVSGLYFTGNPGQSVTANYLLCSPASYCPPNGYMDYNVGGDILGSRQTNLIGYYEIPVPPGSYTIQVESVNPGFGGGSSVGPLSNPIAAPGTASPSAPFSVTAGSTTGGIDVVLQGTPPRSDPFESARLWLQVFFAEVMA